jgi:hypothetical protein
LIHVGLGAWDLGLGTWTRPKTLSPRLYFFS